MNFLDGFTLEAELLLHNSVADCFISHQPDPATGVTAYVVLLGRLDASALTDHLCEHTDLFSPVHFIPVSFIPVMPQGHVNVTALKSYREERRG